MAAFAAQIVCIAELLLAVVGAQLLEARAVVELERGGAHRTAAQLGARHEIGAPGARQLAAREGELALGGLAVAAQVLALEDLHRLHRVQLPVGRRRPAAAAGERRGERYGSLISDSRWK